MNSLHLLRAVRNLREVRLAALRSPGLCPGKKERQAPPSPDQNTGRRSMLAPSSSPDLIRRPIRSRKKMDARVKPGHHDAERLLFEN